MQPFFFIRSDHRYVKVPFADILYLEADRNYIRIACRDKTHLVLLSLKQMEDVLPAKMFCRVHRSYIVALSVIHSIDNNHVYLESIPNHKSLAIPVGSQYRKALNQHLNLVFSDVRGRGRVSKLSIESLIGDAEN
jgi:DNA-binding LytR/AlgR family response regulator